MASKPRKASSDRDPTEPCPKCGEIHEHCLAHRRNGKQCRGQRLKGRMLCYRHKGAPSGPCHPGWKNGRRSKLFDGIDDRDLRERLMHRAEVLRSDAESLSLLEHLAVLDEQVVDALNDAGEAEGLWARAGKLVAAQRAAFEAKDVEAVARTSRELEQVVEAGSAHVEAMREVRRRIEARRKVTDTEARARKASADVVLRAVHIASMLRLTEVWVRAARTHGEKWGVDAPDVQRMIASVSDDLERLIDASGVEAGEPN